MDVLVYNSSGGLNIHYITYVIKDIIFEYK